MSPSNFHRNVIIFRSNIFALQYYRILGEGGANDTAGGLHTSLDPMIQNVYSFGRQWIIDQLSQKIIHPPSRELLETELVGIWDSLYESWVTKVSLFVQ